MEFYFDIDFLKSLLSVSFDEDVFEDFRIFTKNLHDVDCFVFHDDDIQNQDIAVNPFFKTLMDIAHPKFLKRYNLNIVLNSDSGSGFKYFFLKSMEIASEIRDDFGFFCISSIELNNKWKVISSSRQDLRKFITDQKGPHHFTSWSELKEFILPLNSIVIADRYLFSKEENLEYNLFELLNNLGLKPLKKRKIDILILGNDYFNYKKAAYNNHNHLNSFHKNNNGPHIFVDGNREFKKAFNLMVDFFNQKLGPDNYNLTFLRADKWSIPKDTEFHYRILFTNVLFLNCGNSFTFFEKSGDKIKPRSGEYFNIDFFLNRNARGPNYIALKKLKQGFNNIDNRPERGNRKPITLKLVHNAKKCQLLVNI